MAKSKQDKARQRVAEGYDAHTEPGDKNLVVPVYHSRRSYR